MWLYQSTIGDIYIKLMPNGLYSIIYNNTVYGSYQNPHLASGDVYTHTTGIYDWDSLDCEIFDVPSDLSEWIFIQPQSI